MQMKHPGKSLQSQSDQVEIRKPKVSDGGPMWELVKETGVLDVNSSYSYLMLSKFFQDTCMVAVNSERLIGFVTGFKPPHEPDTLFVWQIAVSDHYRGQGLGTRLLHQLVSQQENIRYVTATISPSNKPSQSLFRKFASTFGTSVSVDTAQGFTADQFPGGNHEAEHLFRVGPLKQ